MKKSIVILLTGLLAGGSVLAQNFEGVVSYERVTDPAKAMANNPNADRMRAQFGNMPAQRPTIYTLILKNQESVFKVDPNQEAGENSVVINGERRSFPRRLSKDETLYNLEEGTYRKYEEYAQQPFQVSGKYERIRWKVDPTQTRPVLGYECMMATASESEQRTMPVFDESGKMTMKDTVVTTEITAWFTDAIPSAAGPDKYNGLPGLILALDLNDGVTTFVATKVNEVAVSADDMKINSKGKKMTPEQLDKLKKEHQAEQMKNFRGGGPGGRVMVIGRGG